MCDPNTAEDELRFLFQCPLYGELRPDSRLDSLIKPGH